MVNFELIKGRIEQYTLSSQIIGCLKILDKIQDENQITSVWNVFVLMKWVILYTSDSPSLHKAETNDVIDTLNLIYQFETDNSYPVFENGITSGFKILAYQQFWLQEKASNVSFTRQLQLFCNISHKSNFSNEFKAYTGITIKQFLHISYTIQLYFNVLEVNKDRKYSGFVENEYFDMFKDKIESGLYDKYFKLLTLLKTDNISSFQKMTKEICQLYETNFLSIKPFILINNKYKVPHRAIFNQTCKYFIYDFLKQSSPSFTEEFGSVAEKYITIGLKEIGLNFETENDLQKKYPNISKVVDFSIENNVLLESKAIELHPRAAVLRNPKILLSELDKSIVKAYCQLLNTAHTIDNSKVFYGLIVTYKETFLGFGKDAWNEFLEIPINKYCLEKSISIDILPPENVWFIDIETWDQLLQVIKDYNCSIQDVLEKAKIVNSNKETKRFLFEQIIREYYPISTFNLSYLENSIAVDSVLEN